MSTASQHPSWMWDPTRGKYYRYDPSRSLYIFADGEVIAQDGRVIATGNTVLGATPTLSSSQTRTTAINHTRSDNTVTAYGTPSAYPAETLGFENLTLSAPDPSTTRTGRELTGEGDLDSRYRVRRSNSFWSTGKVIRVLWPEPAAADRFGGALSTVQHYATSRSVGVHLKIAWFVVIQPGPSYSICLRILTYGNRGVSKAGLNPTHHSIVYTTATDPGRLPDERLAGLMLKSIRVRPESRVEHLDRASRINYGKVYTVEHDLKVFHFGQVSAEHISRFRRNYRQTLESLAQNVSNSEEGEVGEVTGVIEQQEDAQDVNEEGDGAAQTISSDRIRQLIHSLRSSNDSQLQSLATWLDSASHKDQEQFLAQYLNP